MSLTVACFGARRYEDAAAKKCFSNLLSAGFRRFVVDIYWNRYLNQWGLCPVAATAITVIPSGGSTTEASSTLGASTLSASSLTFQDISTTQTVTKRQVTTSAFSTSATSSTPVAPTQVPGSPGVYQIGEYQCSPTVTLDQFLGVLEDHFLVTANILNATLKYLILNVNEATQIPSAVSNSSLSPAPPIARTIRGELLPSLYTPDILASQRANLNASWLNAPVGNQPDLQYLNLNTTSKATVSTFDGFPNEGYIELIQARRVLIAFGSISLDDTQFDMDADAGLIFRPGTLTALRDVTLTGSGNIENGCFFSTNDLRFSGLNNSFAVAPIQGSQINPAPYIQCGISPLLNTSLLSLANENAGPYITFIQQSIWSWNLTGLARAGGSDPVNCAIINTATGLWEPESCSARHIGACRVGSEPYEWALSRQQGNYNDMARVCPSNSSFDVPRTALENAYLRRAIARSRGTAQPQIGTALAPSGLSAQSSVDAEYIWINLNDVDISGCWVSGVNATCPYITRPGEATRTVVVSIIVGIIILILAGLTIFVKCAANRAGVKRRRRRRLRLMSDKFGEYEGVPS